MPPSLPLSLSLPPSLCVTLSLSLSLSLALSLSRCSCPLLHPWESLEKLVELLQHTGNEVPRWLEGMSTVAARSAAAAASQIEVQ